MISGSYALFLVMVWVRSMETEGRGELLVRFTSVLLSLLAAAVKCNTGEGRS